MTIKVIEGERVRAWVLIRVEVAPGAEPPYAEAQRVYDVLGYKQGQEYEPWTKSVVVRAEVVDYHYNIVVPVDAESLEALQYLVCEIQKLTGATQTAVLRVLAPPNPFPPHAADGYITREEAGEYDDDGQVIVGRQRTSPGVNPWG